MFDLGVIHFAWDGLTVILRRRVPYPIVPPDHVGIIKLVWR